MGGRWGFLEILLSSYSFKSKARFRESESVFRGHVLRHRDIPLARVIAVCHSVDFRGSLP